MKTIKRKRAVVFILSFCMLFAGVGNGFAADDTSTSNSFLGKWFLTSISTEEVEVEVVDIGIELYVDISDKNVIVYGKYEAEEYSEIVTNFSYSGPNLVMFLENNAMLVFRLEDSSHMSCKNEECTLVFSKEWDVLKTMPSRLLGVQEDQFFGSWKASHVVIKGVKMPASLLDTDILLDIKRGKAVFQISDLVTNIEAKMEADTYLSSDVLVVNVPGMIFVVCLHSDGTASFEFEGNTVILKKTEI